MVVVSCPANSSVTAWSRTTPAGSGDPASSVAASSRPRTPRPGSPRRRRSSISARTSASSRLRAAIARASGVLGAGSSWSRTGSPWIASDSSNACAIGCSRPPVTSSPSRPRSAILQRQLAGPVVDLERLALDERFARRHRLLDHRLRHARDVFAMERRQHQHPEVAVIGAVDVQHPVAEQRPQIRKPALAPRERVEVADQDLVVDLGADRPHDRLVQQPNREHRTEPPLVLEQQPERVGDDPARVREARGRAPRGELPPGGGPAVRGARRRRCAAPAASPSAPASTRRSCASG